MSRFELLGYRFFYCQNEALCLEVSHPMLSISWKHVAEKRRKALVTDDVIILA
jgi:hypothetical protein